MLKTADLKGLSDRKVVEAFVLDKGLSYASVCEAAGGYDAGPRFFFRNDMPLDFARALCLSDSEKALFFEAAGYPQPDPSITLEAIAEKKTPATSVASLVHELRIATMHSMGTAAEKMGISKSYFQGVENGDEPKTSIKFNRKITKALVPDKSLAAKITSRLDELSGNISIKLPVEEIFRDPNNEDFSNLHHALRTQHLRVTCKELAGMVTQQSGVSFSRASIENIDRGFSVPDDTRLNAIASVYPFNDDQNRLFLTRGQAKRQTLERERKNPTPELTRLLKEDMEAATTTPTELHKKSGVARTTIGKIIRGVNPNVPEADTVLFLVDALGIEGDRRALYFASINREEPKQLTVNQTLYDTKCCKNISTLLLSLRQARGLKVSSLAERSGVSEAYINKLEQQHEEGSNPNVETLSKLAIGLELRTPQFKRLVGVAGKSLTTATELDYEEAYTVRIALQRFSRGEDTLNHTINTLMIERGFNAATLANKSGVKSAVLEGLLHFNTPPSEEDLTKIGQTLKLDRKRELPLLLTSPAARSVGFEDRVDTTLSSRDTTKKSLGRN